MSSQRERFKVLGAGIFSLILVLGVARFAYTPLLPIMQQQAGLGLAEAGWLAALNYAGYLSGALIASLISDLVLKDRLYRIGLVVAIVSTAIKGAARLIVARNPNRAVAIAPTTNNRAVPYPKTSSTNASVTDMRPAKRMFSAAQTIAPPTKTLRATS